MSGSKKHAAGFTLTEVLVTVVILALILVGIAGVLEQTLRAESATRERNDLTRQARFAMDRMTAAVSATRYLMLPLAENPGTVWSESVREPGVLAVTLDPTLDRDNDGWADGNNDKDFLDINQNAVRDPGEPERIDEDPHDDISNDSAPGIVGIDDDGDGLTDEGSQSADDDEDGQSDEDRMDGVDNDGDGSVDEDTHADRNKDDQPGVAGVDDDLDGQIDEGSGVSAKQNDDEDDLNQEDWLDAVVYFLSGATLVERMPNVNPLNGNDFTERVIADNVTRFRVERVPQGAGRAVLVDISLDLSGENSTVELHTRVRVGAGS
ncbi:MAG: prepilin-type N-terminal cleavage/methylation domain-containing protein [Gammaproteobacteria bacterium]|nr:prepilin-type N-terminal cleavage/methylation domain-containing protein [Gammaproteobacteria bacterium]